MELRHLRYFIAVAEEKSFLKAAERLHLSQPPLSTQVRDLEAELSVQLLDRTSKGVTTTMAGEVYYHEAREIMARVERARLLAQRTARGEEGKLTIGFVSIVDYSFLPAALKLFRARFPRVEVQLNEMTTDAQLRELASETLDLGIALAPVDQRGLEFHHLQSEALVLAAASRHPALAQGGRKVSLRDLAHEPFVMIPRSMAPGYYDVFLDFCRASGFTPNVAQRATQMQTVISLVSSGFGIALVPQSLTQLRRTGVAYGVLREKSPSIAIGLVHRKDDRNPVVAAFLATVREAIRDQAPARKAARA